MRYTKAQIAQLGIRPRERKGNGLLPCERKEVKAVIRALLNDKDSDELWQYWRLIPFEEGYACQQRKLFEEWVKEEVENMWYDIGRPVFDEEDGTWSCPEGGWWPYLKTKYLDISWLEVGNAIIDMDEVWTTLRNYLEEKVQGYRMCPGMKLYRTVIKYLEKDDLASAMKANSRDLAELERLRNEMAMLANIFPTAATAKAPDREYYSTKYVRYKNEEEKN